MHLAGFRSLATGLLLTNRISALVINTPAPMLQPVFPTCEQLFYAQSGLTCERAASSYFLATGYFLELNPGLYRTNCNTLQPYVWYCVKEVIQAPPFSVHPPPPPPQPTLSSPPATPLSASHPPPATPAPSPPLPQYTHESCWRGFRAVPPAGLAQVSSWCSSCLATPTTYSNLGSIPQIPPLAEKQCTQDNAFQAVSTACACFNYEEVGCGN